MRQCQSALDCVIILEDETLLAMELEDALRDRGARDVHAFARGDEGLTALQTLTPRLLIIDFQLADSGDGFGLAEVAIQIFNPPPHLIFATAEPNRLPATLAKTGRVFPKPYDIAQLADYAASL